MNDNRALSAEVFAHLRRYAGLIDDWPAFHACVTRAQPQALWPNTCRVSADRFAEIVAREGLPVQALAWRDGAFRMPHTPGLGARWWYRVGLAHSQDESSQLPVTVLAPQPGERVLDLCAAPGGKTAQIAVALGGRGTVVANDISAQRMRPLRETIERLALANVTLTAHDGANYPLAAGPFDAVLVDAPCTCEGTLRKNALSLQAIGAPSRRSRARLQQALLRRAIALCRPGGRIVYATCTFAPEENEAVVDAVLSQCPDAVRAVAPTPLPGLQWLPGITHWRGQAYDPSLACTRRLWPHHNDTGGFYVALLHKRGATVPRQGSPSKPALPESMRSRVISRFGVPAALLAGHRLVRESSNGLHGVVAEHQIPAVPPGVASGLRVYRHKGKPPTLTTVGARLFGAEATRHCVELREDQLSACLARNEIHLQSEQLLACTQDGFVIMRHQGLALGVGVLDVAGRRLRSLYPKTVV